MDEEDTWKLTARTQWSQQVLVQGPLQLALQTQRRNPTNRLNTLLHPSYLSASRSKQLRKLRCPTHSIGGPIDSPEATEDSQSAALKGLIGNLSSTGYLDVADEELTAPLIGSARTWPDCTMLRWSRRLIGGASIRALAPHGRRSASATRHAVTELVTKTLH